MENRDLDNGSVRAEWPGLFLNGQGFRKGPSGQRPPPIAGQYESAEI